MGLRILKHMITVNGIWTKMRMAASRRSSATDLYALVGAGVALIVLLLFYFLLVVPENSEISTPVAVVLLAIAASPLFIAAHIEQTTGSKIFTDIRDFSVAIAWFPLTIMAMMMTEETAIIVAFMVIGFLVDPVLNGKRRSANAPATRAMIAYSRGLCGIIGTILVITFIFKVSDIGNPKNKKTLGQEILSAVFWGMLGKMFFDFIGVTKPIPLARLFSKSRLP